MILKKKEKLLLQTGKSYPPPPLRLAAFVKFESKKGIPKRHSVMIRYTTVVPISAHFSMSASLEVRSLIRKTVVYVSVLQLFFFM